MKKMGDLGRKSLEQWNRAKRDAGEVNAILAVCLILCVAPFFAFENIRQGALTFLGVLLIGFVAYPWQKERDQKIKISEERRDVYRNFFAAADNYFWHLVQENRRPKTGADKYKLPEEPYVALEQAKARVALNSSMNMLQLSGSYMQALKDFHTAVQNYRECGEQKKKALKEKSDAKYESVERARFDALTAARCEVMSVQSVDPGEKEYLRKLYRLPPEKEEETQ
ncbi:hypothetical protein ACTTAL_16255 [Rhodobacter capsulatus]|uniref:hypothetical protein n=1 Tax=Rhodobacter capsulatus TaxID=1061 RepID=UPI00103914D9|nr:hypothetical protein [Rhodobacter capsulatus]